MKFRQIATLAAKIVATLLMLWLVLSGIDMRWLAERLRNISPGWMLLSVLAGLAQILIQAPRWRAAVVAVGVNLGLVQAFQYCMIGMFFNQVLPSGVGGDAARIWFLRRQSGWQRAAYSAMVDRGFGLLALAAMIVVSLPFSLQLMTQRPVQMAVVAIGSGTLAAGLGFVYLGFFRWPGTDRFAIIRHFHSCAELAARLLFNWRSGPWMFAASIGIHVLSPVAAYAAGRSIQADVSLVQMLLLIPPVMIITMLPVSVAGWGLREASMSLAFTSAGLAQGDGLVVSLLFGLSQFVVGIVGGIMWIAMPKNAEVVGSRSSAAE